MLFSIIVATQMQRICLASLMCQAFLYCSMILYCSVIFLMSFMVSGCYVTMVLSLLLFFVRYEPCCVLCAIIELDSLM